jgi:hypothetical protein
MDDDLKPIFDFFESKGKEQQLIYTDRLTNKYWDNQYPTLYGDPVGYNTRRENGKVVYLDKNFIERF